jgi:ABC-type phosphate transport system substrate-binding protein
MSITIRRFALQQLLALAALVLIAVTSQSAGAQVQQGAEATAYKIVINAANPVSSLTREEVSRLFLKKVTMWKDAKPVALVDQKPSSPVRERFTRDVHGRQVASVTSYWQQMIFSGRAVPPIEKASDADVAAFVAANPAAIGYVASNVDLPSGVKVVALTK